MVVDQLAAGSWVFLFLWLSLIAYIVPDGHPLSPRWRRWVRLGLVGVVAFLVGAAGDAGGFRESHHGADPPLTWCPRPVSGVLGVVGLLLTVLLLFGAAFAVRARLRQASGDARLQLLWLVWGATSLPLGAVLAWAAHFLLRRQHPALRPRAHPGGRRAPGHHRHRDPAVPPLRHPARAEPHPHLRRAGVAVVAFYALLLFGADRLLGDSTAGGLLAVGIVAVAVQPAYALLRARIERWVYGYRSDPAAALRRLGASVESADPLHVVDTITASVADALKVDRVWVEVPGEEVTDDAGTTRVPLVHRGDRIGDLAVEVPAGRTLSTADMALLHDLAQHAAVTVRAAQLARELQASRSRIVTTREEERKRLRRDLHDGVGPALAAILLKLQAAQSRRDEAERNALLGEIREETKAAITEVRRVVDDLRPPAIDEVGLVGAIRQRAASLSTDELVFEVQGPDVALAATGGRRGRSVPDRLGGDDQRRAALRREALPRPPRARRDAGDHGDRQRPGQLRPQ